MILLNDEDWETFVAHLDEPPAPTEALRQLLRREYADRRILPTIPALPIDADEEKNNG